MTAPGPALVDLEEMTHATTSEVTIVFAGRGFVALVGSMLLGLLFDYLSAPLIIGVVHVSTKTDDLISR